MCKKNLKAGHEYCPIIIFQYCEWKKYSRIYFTKEVVQNKCNIELWLYVISKIEMMQWH